MASGKGKKSKKSPIKKKVVVKSKKVTSKSVQSKKKSTKKASAVVSPLPKYKDKEYKSLYQKIWRRKKAKDELVKGKKKGWKTKRTKIYKEIVSLNKQIISLCKKKKYKIPDSVKLRLKKQKSAQKKETEYFRKEKRKEIKGYNVWNFEKELVNYIKGKRFKKIIFPDVNKIMDIGRNTPSTILYWYDKARDMAYDFQLSGSPYVECIEDYGNSTLTITIV